MTGARITIVGGGSNQWVPKLVNDIAHAPPLQDAEIVLLDIDPTRLPRMQAYVEHVAAVLGIPLRVRATTDQRAALDGAEYVVVNISTGGFESMSHDLDIPARYGIRQSVGDTVGPGGIMRALRNIPVLVGIARDMVERCPEAWLLNLTNPMTTLCRSVSKHTPIRTVGLCHEVTISQFYLSLLLDVSFLELHPTVVGINHLPVITALDAGGEDGLARLAALLDSDELDAPLSVDLPEEMGIEPPPAGEKWTRRRLLDGHRLKMELFRRTGALPAAGDRHLAEFFPGFLTEASGHGAEWGIKLTTIEARRRDEQAYSDAVDAAIADPDVPDLPSGEMVHAVIGALRGAFPALLPLNIPNAGQCTDLPDDVIVESMCLVTGDGIRGHHRAGAPPLLAEQLRRVSAAQELTVEAAMTGDRETLFAAMVADPLAGRLDWGQLDRMTAEMVEATRDWLPQFT